MKLSLPRVEHRKDNQKDHQKAVAKAKMPNRKMAKEDNTVTTVTKAENGTVEPPPMSKIEAAIGTTEKEDQKGTDEKEEKTKEKEKKRKAIKEQIETAKVENDGAAPRKTEETAAKDNRKEGRKETAETRKVEKETQREVLAETPKISLPALRTHGEIVSLATSAVCDMKNLPPKK